MSDQTPLTNWRSIGALSQDAVKKAARKQFELRAGLTEAANEKDSRMDSPLNMKSEGGVQ